MNILLWRGLMLAVFYVTTAATKLTIYTALSSSYHSATSIDNPRDTHTLLECIRVCHYGYTGCFSVTFNTTTGSCTPGSLITFDASRPQRAPGDLFYYTDSCNTALGFRVFAYKSVFQCLYVSTIPTSYTAARDICIRKRSTLILIKSQDKLDLIRDIVKAITFGHTWIGLNDRVTEGQFVWEDGQTLANSSFKIPWRIDQPDNYLRIENCCEIGSEGDLTYVNDIDCDMTGQFVCEMDIQN